MKSVVLLSKRGAMMLLERSLVWCLNGTTHLDTTKIHPPLNFPKLARKNYRNLGMARKISVSISTTLNSLSIVDNDSTSGEIYLDSNTKLTAPLAFKRQSNLALTNADCLIKFIVEGGETGYFKVADVLSVTINGSAQAFITLSDIISLISPYTFVAATGSTMSDLIFVDSISKLPTPVANVITLEANKTYYFVNDLDLNGSRLVGGSDTTLLGASSENCSITSTGLGIGVPLFTTTWTTPIRHITFADVDTALAIDGTANPPVALDWTGVNFLNVPHVGTIGTCDNFIYSKGAFLNSRGLVIDGTHGTIGIDNSLFNGGGIAGTIIEIASTATITRRFRIIYSSVIAVAPTVGIDVDPLANIPTESFILDVINFSGGGTYLGGLDHTSNDSLFNRCVGITNTAVNGQLYMQSNVTATVVAAPSTFYKVAGTTTPSSDNSKFTHTNNRLTCAATISRKYLIQCTLSFTSGNNNICEFGFYDSQLAAIRTPSRTKATANAAGRAESVHFTCVLSMDSGDYLEIHAANNTGANNITVDQMNFVITEIR